jgi:hypothetical protein
LVDVVGIGFADGVDLDIHRIIAHLIVWPRLAASRDHHASHQRYVCRGKRDGVSEL